MSYPHPARMVGHMSAWKMMHIGPKCKRGPFQQSHQFKQGGKIAKAKVFAQVSRAGIAGEHSVLWSSLIEVS